MSFLAKSNILGKEGAFCLEEVEVHRGADRTFAPRQAERGTPVKEVIWKMGITDQTFYRWKKKYGGLGMSQLRRTRQLEEENRRLRQMVADLSLDKHMLQEGLTKKS